jgi:hypothetical protein
MPSVMDAPELIEYDETPNLTIETLERLQPHRARPGFWRTLAHRITHYLTPTPRERHAPACRSRQPFETPADMLARQYPTLYLWAFSGI